MPHLLGKSVSFEDRPEIIFFLEDTAVGKLPSVTALQSIEEEDVGRSSSIGETLPHIDSAQPATVVLPQVPVRRFEGGLRALAADTQLKFGIL